MNENKKNLILQAVNDTANDINEYLSLDIPLECYQKDINWKMEALKKQIEEIYCS